MTTSEPAHGSIVHIELYSDDAAGTEAFFEEAFDWGFEPVSGMEYTLWRAPHPPHGGLMDRRDAEGFDAPPVLAYVSVDDIDDARDAVSEAGGELLTETMDVAGSGVFSLFREPGGGVEAIWEDRPGDGEPMPEETPSTDEPDPGSIVHLECYTDDVAATRAFHEAAFGWDFEAESDEGYTMARTPSPPFVGLMPATEELSAGTLPYILVEDATAACRTIEAAGGTVVRDPFDVEGWGTMAVFEAPGGVVLAIWEATPGAEPERAERTAPTTEPDGGRPLEGRQ